MLYLNFLEYIQFDPSPEKIDKSPSHDQSEDPDNNFVDSGHSDDLQPQINCDHGHQKRVLLDLV